MTLQKYYPNIAERQEKGLSCGIPWIGAGRLPKDIVLNDEDWLVDPRGEFYDREKGR